jgi:hypothetical protein
MTTNTIQEASLKTDMLMFVSMLLLLADDNDRIPTTTTKYEYAIRKCLCVGGRPKRNCQMVASWLMIILMAT